MLAEHCIYTIKSSSDLEGAAANGGYGRFQQRRNWQSGKRLLEEARRSGKRLPIVFAPAEATFRLFGWGLVDDIIPGPTTTYSFSSMERFENPPLKSTLKKARDGERLNKWFIRPYAICRTPTYLRLAPSVRSTRARRFWTFHWRNQFWRDDVNAEFEPVGASGGNSFRKRGVSVGDVVYIISLAGGHLLLGGKMTVRRIVSRREAVRILHNNRLYNADEWVVDDDRHGTPLHLHRQLDSSISKRLRFFSPAGEEKGLFFISNSELDGQSTRGVRELTPASAALLDRIIDLTDQVPQAEEMVAVTDGLLARLEETTLRSGIRHAQEVWASGVYSEGDLERITVNRYERDERAREECIARHGTTCSVCGFDFTQTYGDSMCGFIHVHHLRLLSDVGPGYRVNPVEDLRPICPNCHAVVHRRNPPYSLEDVRRLINDATRAPSDRDAAVTMSHAR